MKLSILSTLLALSMTGPAMAHERIRISSDWGEVMAELADSAATKALVGMLPVTIEMRDHMRQEKTGDLQSPLPEITPKPSSPKARSAFGVPTTSLSTIGKAGCRSPGSSSLGRYQATYPCLTDLAP